MTNLTDFDAECYVIGSIFLKPSVIWKVSALLAPNDFAFAGNAIIFRALKALVTNGIEPDLKILADYLQRKELLEKIGGTPALTNAMEMTPSAANVIHYANIVHDLAIRRKVRETGQEMIDKAEELAGSPISMVLKSQEKIADLISRNGSNSKSLDELIPAYSKLLDSRANGTQKTLPLGFRDLDAITSGLKGGQLFIIGGRPSMGKSAFVETIALNVASKHHSVLYFSLEMSEEELLDRALAQAVPIQLSKLKTMLSLSDNEKIKIEKAKLTLSQYPLRFNTTDKSYSAIASTILRESMLHKTELVIIDYLHLISSEQKETEAVRLSDLVRKFKLLAMKLNIPIILLSQLNRSVDSRPEGQHCPTLSDFRASGGIEEHADILGALYRPGYYSHNSMDMNVTLVILKNRTGQTGYVPLTYYSSFTRFSSCRTKEES